jgi:hypothetical protein
MKGWWHSYNVIANRSGFPSPAMWFHYRIRRNLWYRFRSFIGKPKMCHCGRDAYIGCGSR